MVTLLTLDSAYATKERHEKPFLAMASSAEKFFNLCRTAQNLYNNIKKFGMPNVDYDEDESGLDGDLDGPPEEPASKKPRVP